MTCKTFDLFVIGTTGMYFVQFHAVGIVRHSETVAVQAHIFGDAAFLLDLVLMT